MTQNNWQGQGSGNNSEQKHVFEILPHPNSTFDENYFLNLVENSISLTLEEKKKVVDSIPRLSVDKINKLISVFESEKIQFIDLAKDFKEDVAIIKKQRQQELEYARDLVKEKEDADNEIAILKRNLLK